VRRQREADLAKFIMLTLGANPGSSDEAVPTVTPTKDVQIRLSGSVLHPRAMRFEGQD